MRRALRGPERRKIRGAVGAQAKREVEAEPEAEGGADEGVGGEGARCGLEGRAVGFLETVVDSQ